MKKLSLLLVALIVIATTTVLGQKPFSGTIKFKSQITGTEDPNVLSQTIPDMEMSVLGNLSMVVLPQEGVSITNIVNGDSKTSFTVIEITGMGKYYIETNEAEIKEKRKFYDFKYEYLDDTKVIAGYTCKKVKSTITDLETDEEEVIIYYVSNEISSNDLLNFTQYPGLVGFPLSIETPMGETAPGAIMVIEATEVLTSKKLKPIDFLLPSDAKNIKEDPELMKMFGMGGETSEE